MAEAHPLACVKRSDLDENSIGKIVIDGAIHVHRVLGHGLLEAVYEAVLARELRKRGFTVERQVPVAIGYGEIAFEEGFRADLIVEGKVIIELKSVVSINDAHKKQLLTYLRLTGTRLGFLLNFGESLMKHGITRIVNGMPEKR